MAPNSVGCQGLSDLSWKPPKSKQPTLDQT